MIIWLISLGIIILLQFAVLFGPPYVPTLERQRRLALDMLKLKPGQRFYDLGCGDGSLLKDAASRGLLAVGYEINPILAAIAWLRTIRHRKQVKIVLGSFWKADITEADGIFVFLTAHHMKKLDNFMRKNTKNQPVKLLSYGFRIPGRKAEKAKAALFLYRYP